MKIEKYALDKIAPYGLNAKRHDQKQISNVANSIKRFGFVQPLVIDHNNTIVIGHCRYEAAKYLGLKYVPCVKASELTPEEIKELRIADNRTNESPWDYDLLEEEMAALKFDGFNFEFEAIDEDDEQQIGNSLEYNREDFGNDKFKCTCPECGFKFNP